MNKKGLITALILSTTLFSMACFQGGAKSSETDILSFALTEQTGPAVINTVNHTVIIGVSYSTELTGLTPEITVSEGAEISPSSGTEVDFDSGSVEYTITAEDGSEQTWSVTVTEALNSANDILGFTLSDQTGSAVIDTDNHTVSIEVSYGTGLTGLVPEITVSTDAGISPSSGTAVDFDSGAVEYTVTSEDGSEQIWSVVVTEAMNSANDITGFTLSEQTGSAVIDTDNHIVSIEVSSGTILTGLIPEITVSTGAEISPSSGTAVDFDSGAVEYTVTAEDGSEQAWSVIVITKYTYSADSVAFVMAAVPGGLTFPTGTEDQYSATVDNGFQVAETEVTYQLWMKVYTWAIDSARGASQYSFANGGTKGSDGDSEKTDQHPVTEVSWRDCLIWCNALTEWYNAHNGTSYSCVYFTDSAHSIPMRSVDGSDEIDFNPGSQDNPYVKEDAEGFRLLTMNEWELAARYRDGVTWLYGDHASGDLSGSCWDDSFLLSGVLSTVFGDYAVYSENSGYSTAVVKSKSAGANTLGLYDMSGSLDEWCFDEFINARSRVNRGGSWIDSEPFLQVGYRRHSDPDFSRNHIGFRLGKN